ncbi:C-type lectin domain family 12 member A isoform 1-T2 [Hipposideros larvatus]
MSEEVTYADLKFDDFGNIKNIQEFDQVDIKAPPAPSHVWRQRTLALALLCLLLLIGLGVLGSIFYRTSKVEMEKLKKLQHFEEELQKNVSLQLMHNMNYSKTIKELSIALQATATKLCYELSKKPSGHKCNPCPEKWKWFEDSCYFLSEDYDTWENSYMTCSAKNASLLKIKNKSVLDFIKSQDLYHWLGISPRKDYINYKKLDETIISSNWFTGNRNDLSDERYCGYIRTMYLEYRECTEKKKFACEKLANPVKTESIVMNEVPDGRM